MPQDANRQGLVLARKRAADCFHGFRWRTDRVPVDRYDDIAGLQPSGLGRGARFDVAHHRSHRVLGHVQPIAQLRRQRCQSQADAGAALWRVVLGRGLTFLGQLPDLQGDVADFAVVHNRQMGFLSGRNGSDIHRQILRAGDFLAIDRLDDIARLQTGRRRWTFWHHARQQRAAVIRQTQRLGGRAGQRLRLHPNIAARDLAGLLQLRRHGADGVRRDREPDADRPAGGGIDRGVHPDDLAVLRKQRPAGVAVIDRRIHLDELVVGASTDIAGDRRDDTGGDRTAEAERVTHRDHPFARFHVARLAEFDIGQLAAGIDLENGDVGPFVPAQHLCR